MDRVAYTKYIRDILAKEEIWASAIKEVGVILATFRVKVNKKRGQIPFFMKCVLLFFFIFDAHFAGFGFPTYLTSRRLVVIILLFRVVLLKRWEWSLPPGKTRNAFKIFFLALMIVVYYASIIRIMVGKGDGIHVLTSAVMFCFTGIAATIGLYYLFDNLNEFLDALICVCMVQILIMLLFMVIPSFQTMIDQLLGVLEMNADYRRRGYITGVSCSTSRGVLRLAMGMAACLYFVLKDKRKSGKYIICFCAIAFISTIMARTGLIFFALGIAIMLLSNMKYDVKATLKVFRIIGGILLFAIFFIFVFQLTDELQEIFRRVIELFEEGIYESFFKAYLGHTSETKRVVPPLSIETLVGIGITSGTSANGIKINVDGGYLRLYAALGLPMAIFFYGSLLRAMIRPIRRVNDRVFKMMVYFVLITIWLVGENKEYYIMEGYPVAVYFCMLLFHDKETIVCKSV